MTQEHAKVRIKSRRKVGAPKPAVTPPSAPESLLDAQMQALVSSEHLLAAFNKDLWEDWASPPTGKLPSPG